ncbi:centrosomal protein of 89 kDa [Arapaima gigas]
MSKFSFRRKENAEFKHIAHGLIPAATIAPRPAVPRTPPPRSPFPYPERPRSALAAAILSSSLTGRTVAIPLMGPRSLSESDCCSRTGVEPYASTANYSRDRWYGSSRGRPCLPRSRSSQDGDADDDDDDDDDGETSIVRETLSDRGKDHIYESLERHTRYLVGNDIYAVPHKQGIKHSCRSDLTDNSELNVASARDVSDFLPLLKASSPEMEQNQSSLRAMSTPDLRDYVDTEAIHKNHSSFQKKSPNRSSIGDATLAEDEEVHQELLVAQQQLVRMLQVQNQELTQKCKEQALQLQQAKEHCSHLQQQLEQHHPVKETYLSAGGEMELRNLRQQAQELVDENDGLKMAVHRLNVELSRYQVQYRPLSKEETSRINGLPKKGPVPPWLVDMKYLSPLLLAYEDRLSEKDSFLRTCEEEMQKLHERVEEVIRENERLHEQLRKKGGVRQKQLHRLQEQATLVLKENQVLLEQLEIQQTKAKESHSCHLKEVSKISKELMLLEAERQQLQEELQEVRRELQAMQTQHQQALSALKGSVGKEEHCDLIRKLQRQLEEEAQSRKAEVEDLTSRMVSLQVENKALLLEMTNVKADMKSVESELKASRCAKRKADQKVALMKLQVEDSLQREMAAHQYLAGIVSLAEKTIHERDQLVNMASTLQHEKEGVLTKIIKGTVRLGKLQEKVKVYKREAATSLGFMSQRLQEQEEDFAGKAASFQREIHHLQQLLQDKQEALDGALQQKREVEGELEIVWKSTSRENQHIKEALFQSLDCAELSLGPPEELDFTKGPSLLWTSRQWEDLPPLTPPMSSVLVPCSFHQNRVVTDIHSARYKSDPDQLQNQSSDEGEKNIPDFYS